MGASFSFRSREDQKLAPMGRSYGDQAAPAGAVFFRIGLRYAMATSGRET
jgi:hypothetical protein